MHRLAILASSVLTLIAVLTMPTAALAAVNYTVVHNYCGGMNGWTTFYKARFMADGTSSVNKLTIDSWVMESDPDHPRFHRVSTWPRVSKTFTPDGTAHSLALARQISGGVDSGVRIMFRMTAWDHGLVAWTQLTRSVTC